MKPVCDSGTCSGMSTRGCTAQCTRAAGSGGVGGGGRAGKWESQGKEGQIMLLLVAIMQVGKHRGSIGNLDITAFRSQQLPMQPKGRQHLHRAMPMGRARRAWADACARAGACACRECRGRPGASLWGKERPARQEQGYGEGGSMLAASLPFGPASAAQPQTARGGVHVSDHCVWKHPSYPFNQNTGTGGDTEGWAENRREKRAM